MSVACRDESDVQFDGSDRGLAGSANITATLVQDDRRSTHRMTNRGRQHGHRAHWDRRPGGSACVIHSPCCPSAGSQPPRERANPRANAGRLQATPSQATLEAGQVPTERHRATPSDARNVTGGQGVAGSNPAVPTGNRSFSNIITSHKSQQKSHLVVQWPCPATGRCHCWGRLARRSARLWPACGRRAWRRRA